MKKSRVYLTIFILSLGVFAWCSSSERVQVWDTITVSLVATFPDGKVFEQYSETTPLTFTVGSWQVIPGIDQGIVWTKIGKTTTLTIKPSQWYGHLYSQHNIQKISQRIFDALRIQSGEDTIQYIWDIAWVVKGKETDADGSEVILFDINPRETWDTLSYFITVLSKKPLTTP